MMRCLWSPQKRIILRTLSVWVLRSPQLPEYRQHIYRTEPGLRDTLLMPVKFRNKAGFSCMGRGVFLKAVQLRCALNDWLQLDTQYGISPYNVHQNPPDNNENHHGIRASWVESIFHRDSSHPPTMKVIMMFLFWFLFYSIRDYGINMFRIHHVDCHQRMA